MKLHPDPWDLTELAWWEAGMLISIGIFLGACAYAIFLYARGDNEK